MRAGVMQVTVAVVRSPVYSKKSLRREGRDGEYAEGIGDREERAESLLKRSYIM